MMEVVVVLALVATVAVLRTTLRRDGGPDVAWSGTVDVGGIPKVDLRRVERGGPRAVARALGRVESRHLARSFSFAVGVAFCALIVVLFGFVWAGDFVERWENCWLLAPIFAYPLVGMTIVGVHSAVTRERRDRTAELFASCPVTPAIRTEAHLRTAWVPVVAVGAFLAVLWLAMVAQSHGFGPTPLRSAGDVLAALALAVGGTFLGVALGRWTPWWPAPIVAIVLVALASSAISGIGEPRHWSPQRQLSTFPRYPEYDPVFAIRPVWWHLAWLASLCAATAVIALVHDRRDRVMATAAGISLVAMLVTGIGTTRPLDRREADLVASMVAHPERHQDCIERRDASICTYGGFDELGRMVADELEPVLARLPAAAPNRLIVRQVFDEPLDELDPEVQSRLPAELPVSGIHVTLGYGTYPSALVAARIATGLWAVGLPSYARPATRMEPIAGEAPGVVALWLAAGGLDRADALELASAHSSPANDGSVDPVAASMAWPDPCEGSGPSPVVWSPQDLGAARALLALPEDEVRRVLDAEWTTWTDRDTTTAELMERFGLPSVGAIDEPPPGEWKCEY